MLLDYGQHGGCRRCLSKVHIYHKIPQTQPSLYSHSAKGQKTPDGDIAFSSSRQRSQVLRPTQPPIQWILYAIPLGIKRPGREADQLTVVEFINAWSYTFTLQYVFMVFYSINSAMRLHIFTFTELYSEPLPIKLILLKPV